jgi:hypothetical protein
MICTRSPGLASSLALLACLGAERAASATVTPDEGDLPAPTVVVMQPGDPLIRPGGPRPGDLRLEYGTTAFLIGQAGPSADAGTLKDVAQLFPSARAMGLGGLTTQLAGSHGRQALYVKVTASRSRDLATVLCEGYDSADPTLEVRTQYQVGPGLRAGEALRIITTVRNTGRRPAPAHAIGDTLRLGGLIRFAPGAGLATPPPGPLPFLLGLAQTGALVYLPAGPPPLSQHDPLSSTLGTPQKDLAPGASASYSRLLIAGDPYRTLCTGPAPVLGRIAVRGSVREEPAPQASAHSRDGAKDGVKEAQALRDQALVLLVRPDGQAVSVARPDPGDGAFALCAREPGPYRLRLSGPGQDAPGTPVQAPSAAAPPLLLRRPAHLHLQLREAPPGHTTPRPAPGRVLLTALDGSASRDPRAASAGGLPLSSSGKLTTVLAPGGEAELSLPPGRYRVSAGRGLFYDFSPQEVDLRPGEVRKLTLQLRRGVPLSETQAGRCTLLHPLPEREAQALGRADGLDLVLVAGAQPTPAGRRQQELPQVPSALIATHRGRFILYPLRVGALLPEVRQAPTSSAVVASLHRVPGEGSSPPLVQGAFPAVAEADQAGADARELWSGPDPGKAQAEFPAALAGWLAALSRGARDAAVAGLDPRADPLQAGLPRTCAGQVQTAQPLGPGEALRLALSRGDAQVTNGPWLRLSANGAGIGELAGAPQGKVQVSLSAWAAAHVDLREIEVWAGTRLAAKIPVPPATTPLRYRGTLPLEIDRDTAIVAVARGARPSEPGLPLPLAFTNPVFVDRDGDGHFGPPKPGTGKRSR